MTQAVPFPLASFDGKTLPFESRSFDVVLLFGVLHLTAEEALVQEARRIVKDGGVVIVSEPSVDSVRDRWTNAFLHIRRQRADRIKRDGRFRTREGWRALFQKAGLTVDRTVNLGRTRWFRPDGILYMLSKS